MITATATDSVTTFVVELPAEIPPLRIERLSSSAGTPDTLPALPRGSWICWGEPVDELDTVPTAA